MHNFLINQLIEFIFLHLLAITEGWLVLSFGVRVNYTRKINHFFVFFSPFLFKAIIPYESSLATTLLLPVVSLLSLCIYVKPLRERVKLIQYMFAAFDRPEDRPHTLKWLFTQYLATYAVAIPFYIYFNSLNSMFLLNIIILINGIGDGLAEPVGVRFGVHKYATRALFSSQSYTRSIEGSLCVFIVSIITILCFSSYLSQFQLIASLLLIPAGITLAEAYSPHTWDSPFLFLAGGLMFTFIMHFH